MPAMTRTVYTRHAGRWRVRALEKLSGALLWEATCRTYDLARAARVAWGKRTNTRRDSRNNTRRAGL